MTSGLRFSGAQTNGNETEFRSLSGFPIGVQQGSSNMMDNQLMNPMMDQNLVETDNRTVRDGEIGIDFIGSGDEQVENIGNSSRKKRYHRHTQYQIQELENFFKNCPHPDDKLRKVLSRTLRLEPLQVKFWFQNKRTQMKMHHERHENTQLRIENERLHAENLTLRDSIGTTACLRCGVPTAAEDLSLDEHHLRMENDRLKEEIDRMTSIAAQCVTNATALSPSPVMPESSSRQVNGTGTELIVASGSQVVKQIGGSGQEMEKQVIVELVVSAMEELIWLSQVIEPLWVPVLIDGSINYLLNEDEYFQSSFFRAPAPRRPGFRSEATRESLIVMMDHANLVALLMNVSRWASLFCAIVAKAMPVKLLATGVAGSYDGALELVNVEYHMITPFVPTRETSIARFCKHQCDGIWAVVEVSLDGVQGRPMTKFRKRPSGCLVQQLFNGCSKITWIEHVEVEENGMNCIYRKLINSGAAFGAKHWLSILNGQCQRFACSMAIELPPNDVNNLVNSDVDGRRRMLKLSERMVIEFCNKTGAASNNAWTNSSCGASEEIKVTAHKIINEPGRPNGIIISVATSIWLPAAPKRVFEFFRDENSRDKWDILTTGSQISKIAHITTGEHVGNNIVLLRVTATPENSTNILLLQESIIYPTGSFVVYAPVDFATITKVVDGGDTNDVRLLPSGFAILPDGSSESGHGPLSGGSFLTMVFQVLLARTSDTKFLVTDLTILNNLMSGTLVRVKTMFRGTVDS